MTVSSICIDALGDGDISLYLRRGEGCDMRCVIVGIPKRQGKTLANRILHEIAFAEGRRPRRPSTPHLFFNELQPCMDCGRKNATPCAGRSGRACPLASEIKTERDTAMPGMKSFIVYGPPACGKTRNAEKIAAFLRCPTVVDEWRDRDDRQPITLGALHLTDVEPRYLGIGPDVVIYPFSDIMADIEVVAEIRTAEPAPPTLPYGEYAIVEIMGHRTIVGSVQEVERFGSKMLSIEPLFADQLLAPVMIGGASIYQLTPCSADTARKAAPSSVWSLPPSMRGLVPPAMLPAPVATDHDDLPF